MVEQLVTGKTMSPRKGKGRPAKNSSPDARHMLISATSELLKTHSPAQLNRIGIANKAGVDPGLIRYYFGDTDRLLRETAAQLIGNVRERRRAAQTDQTSFRGKLSAHVQHLIEALHKYPFLHDLLVHQIAQSGRKEANEMRAEFVDAPFQEVQMLVTEAIDHHEIRPVNIAYFYIAMIGMCSFAMRNRAVMQQVIGRPVSVTIARDYAEFVVETLLHGARHD